jgi:hypothetical protein
MLSLACVWFGGVQLASNTRLLDKVNGVMVNGHVAQKSDPIS